MSSETVTVYIAGVLPLHQSFDAPIVASAKARKTAKFYVVPRSPEGDDFAWLTRFHTNIPHDQLSLTRVGAAQQYVQRRSAEVDATLAAYTKAQQEFDAAVALLDFEKANPQ